GAVKDVAPAGVIYPVAATPVRPLLHALDPVLRPIVHEHVGARDTRDLKLLGRARGGDDARAERLPELHRGEPDAARRAVDEQGFTAAERGPVNESAPGGLVGEAERS